MQVHIEKRPLRADARGWIFEPVEGDTLGRFRNVHAVMSVPGAVRGNHVHDRGTEVLVVGGPVLVRVEEAGEVQDHHVPAGEIWQFTFPPGVPHAIENTGNHPVFMIGFNTVVHDRAAPDTRPHPLL
jgi:dTDP-4-dehydrorhamnose 3,5-epimerase-like enzyme